MEKSKHIRKGTIVVCVNGSAAGNRPPIRRAIVLVYPAEAATGKAAAPKKPPRFGDRSLGRPAYLAATGRDGCCTFEDVEPGAYEVLCRGFVPLAAERVEVQAGCVAEVCFEDPVSVALTPKISTADCEEVPCDRATVGRPLLLHAELGLAKTAAGEDYGQPRTGTNIVRMLRWNTTGRGTLLPLHDRDEVMQYTPAEAGRSRIAMSVHGYPFDPEGGPLAEHGGLPPEGPEMDVEAEIFAEERPVQAIGGSLDVTLRRSGTNPTRDQALWVAIRNRTQAIAFSNSGGGGFKAFVDRVLCERQDSGSAVLDRKLNELGGNAYGVGAYDLLKTAAEVFLLLECGVAIAGDEPFRPLEESGRLGRPATLDRVRDWLSAYMPQGRLPYLERVLQAAFPGQVVDNLHCDGALSAKVDCPCLLELIWSYWHEEGMLVQSINTIARRFQNIRAPGDRDPLAHLEIAPLRPLNNILWGYVQDEQHRLTVKRRAYEYDHHYGLALYGKAVPALRTADSRSKFLEGFHNLLHVCSQFYRDHNDTTVIPDGFPLLNALKEVHLLLAQGAHNQFGDLPWTARAEMLVQEWILARPEIRDFLQSRAMVPYKEAWMPQVDTLKSLYGWSDVGVTHFRDLGVYGEQILLSIRYGDWIDVNDEDSAKNWAIYFRPEIQSYLHAYRAVTGVDLTNPDTVDFTLPSVLLRKRMAAQPRSR